MPFTTRATLIVGIIILVTVGGCLLWLHPSTQTVSYTPSEASSTNTGTSTIATSSIDTTKQAANSYDFATVNGITFEIATSSAKQEKGLSDRASIPDNYAMLFVFTHDDTYGFWMIHMLEPLDMIWLSDNGTIVSITHDALPSSYPNVFYPPVPIRYVLETRVGLAAEKGWVIGTRIDLPLPYGDSVSK